MGEDKGLELLLRVATGQADARFRPGQREAIVALARDRRRMLVTQLSGWGKSTACLLATRLLVHQGEAPTLLVSPFPAATLIAEAGRIGVLAADWTASTVEEREHIRDSLLSRGLDLVSVSPVHLSRPEFLEACLVPIASRIGLLVIEEAHILSRHARGATAGDKRLARALRLLPTGIPALVMTDTSDPNVIADLRDRLDLDLMITGSWPP